MQQITNKTDQKRTPLQIITGIFYIISGTFALTSLLVWIFSYGGMTTISNELYLILEIISLTSLGVCILIKKNSVPAITFVGILMLSYAILFKSYIPDLQYYLEGTIIRFFPLWALFMILSLSVVLVYAILHLLNKNNKVLQLWFIPAVPAILGCVCYSIVRIDNIFHTDLISVWMLLEFLWITTQILISIGILLYCISLAKNSANTSQTSSSQRSAAPVYAQPVHQASLYTSHIYPETGQSYPIDSIEELRKYKAMLDEGLISPEDYERKKNEILGL